MQVDQGTIDSLLHGNGPEDSRLVTTNTAIVNVERNPDRYAHTFWQLEVQTGSNGTGSPGPTVVHAEKAQFQGGLDQ